MDDVLSDVKAPGVSVATGHGNSGAVQRLIKLVEDSGAEKAIQKAGEEIFGYDPTKLGHGSSDKAKITKLRGLHIALPHRHDFKVKRGDTNGVFELAEAGHIRKDMAVRRVCKICL
jgi:hypothetical protein